MISARLAAPRAPLLALLLAIASTLAYGQPPAMDGAQTSPAAPPSVYDSQLSTPAWGEPVKEFGATDAPPPADGPIPLAPPDQPGTWDDSMLGGGMMGGFGSGGGRSPLRYRSEWQPGVPVSGQAANLELWRQDLSLMAPVWRNGPDMLMLSLGVAASQFDAAAVLPDSGRPFPDELWNVRLGANYNHRFDNGWTGGIGVNVGSASDQPFAELRDVRVGTMAFLRIPVYEHDAWNFSLMYSPFSELPFPIPGISYQWQPSDDFHMNIGLPLRVMYRPCEDLTLDVSYMLLRTIHARTTYRLGGEWHVYGGFDWESQSWFLHDRVDDQERLFSYDKRLSLGLRGAVFDHFQVDLAAGYLFDRYYFTGDKFSDDDHDRIDLGNGLFLSLQAGLRW